MDLTQISVMIGRSACPSPKGDGIVLSPFLGDDGEKDCQVKFITLVTWILWAGSIKLT